MNRERTDRNLNRIVTAETTLENIVDRIGLSQTLGLLSYICHEKAEHLRVNWQDESTASVWESAAERIETAQTRKPVVAVSPTTEINVL